MNRRSFIANCLAGAVLGVTRHLPMPAAIAVSRIDVLPPMRGQHFDVMIMDDIISDASPIDTAFVQWACQYVNKGPTNDT